MASLVGGMVLGGLIGFGTRHFLDTQIEDALSTSTPTPASTESEECGAPTPTAAEQSNSCETAEYFAASLKCAMLSSDQCPIANQYCNFENGVCTSTVAMSTDLQNAIENFGNTFCANFDANTCPITTIIGTDGPCMLTNNICLPRPLPS